MDRIPDSTIDFRKVIEDLPHMVWLADADGLVSYMNTHGREYLGDTQGQALGAGWIRFVHPEDRDHAQRTWDQSWRQGLPYQADYRLRTSDGSWRWNLGLGLPLRDDQGRVVQWLGTCTDIEARVTAEHQLKEHQAELARSLALLDALQGSAPVGLALLDEEQRFVRVNAKLADLNGLEPAAHVGRPADQVMPMLWDQLREPCAAALASGRPAVSQEVRATDAAGVPHDWLASCYPVRTEGGPPGVGLALYEITEHRQLEDRLTRFQRLEALGRLAGGIAHDLNNILVPVFGYLDMHLGNLAPGTKLHGDLSEVRRGAERAAELTRRILAFSRQQVLRVEPVDVNAVVEEAAVMLRRLLGERITLVLDLARDLPRARVDAHQVSQVTIELAVNARDAMPGGGRLVIRTAWVQLDAPAAASVGEGLEPGPWVVLTVADEGVGMTPEVRDRVFDPFFTTKRPGQASGLGLSTVFGIVQQHGGAIGMTTAPGAGTTVTIHLPVASQPAVAGSTHPPAPARPPGEVILVTEDEPVVRRLVCEALTDQGYLAIAAQDGDDALRKARALPHGPDLLLTDVILPGLNGTQVLASLRQAFPDLKVLYMSGYTDDIVAEQGVLAKDIHLLQKPFTIPALLREVRKALDRAPRHAGSCGAAAGNDAEPSA